MIIIVDIGHPSQVHFFKNLIWEMEKKGHRVFITAAAKDVTIKLLNAYGFDFVDLGYYGNTLIEKIVKIPVLDYKMYKEVKNLNPDLFVGFGSIRAAHVAWLMRKPCILFDDDEYSYPYYHWFVKTVCVFSGFKLSGKKIIKVPGFKELAYLHPHWFSSKHSIFLEEPITLLRFVSWNAFHDFGQRGFNLDFKRKLVKELGRYSKVYISSESPMPEDLERYRVNIKPEEIHYFLSNVKLLVSDSQTMTTEAAVMGIPAVRCNSFVGENDMGNFRELEHKYNLIFNYKNPNHALEKAIELIKKPGLELEWKRKRQYVLREKIDVTAFMIWFIENYPQSFKVMKFKGGGL